ncbi:hypothetical protein ES703_109829 [subsurface metagenome]
MRIIEAHGQLQVHRQVLHPIFPGEAIGLPGNSAYSLRYAIDHDNNIKAGRLDIKDKSLLLIHCPGQRYSLEVQYAGIEAGYPQGSHLSINHIPGHTHHKHLLGTLSTLTTGSDSLPGEVKFIHR